MMRRNLWQYPAKTQPVQEVTLPTLDWLVQQPDPVRRSPELTGEQLAFSRVVELSEIPIGWLLQHPDPTLPLPRPATESVLVEFGVPIPPVIPDIDFIVQHPDPLPTPPPTQTEPILAFEHEDLIPPPDWLAQHPDPIQGLRRPPTEPVAPELAEVPPLAVFDWWVQYPDPVQPEEWRQDWYVRGELVEIPIDTWTQPPSQPVLPLPPRQYDYARDFTLPEVVLSEWWQPASQPVRLPLRIQGHLVFIEFAVPPSVLVPFVFRECQALWEIVHPFQWESAVASSGYIWLGEYIPPPSGYIEPAEPVPIPSGYIAVEDGTAPWDMVR